MEGCLVVATAENIPRLGQRLTAYARLALKAFGIDPGVAAGDPAAR